MKKIFLCLVFILVFVSIASGQRPGRPDHQYFIGDDIGECARYIDKLNALAGYPNPETKTLTIAEQQPHPNQTTHPGKCIVILKAHKVDGQGKMTQKGVWSPKLRRRLTIEDFNSVSTPAERGKRMKRSELQAIQ